MVLESINYLAIIGGLLILGLPHFLPQELQRRCSTLITLIEREIVDLEEKGKPRGGLTTSASSASLTSGQKRKSTAPAVPDSAKKAKA